MPSLHSPRAHGISPAGLELRLTRDTRAPAQARAAVREWLEPHRVPATAAEETLVLLVSEVVSNAVLHSSGPAGSPIVLTASAGEDFVAVAVSDAGDGFTYTPGAAPEPSEGYGLYLLDRTTRRWGIDTSDGTRVWFELGLDRQAPGGAPTPGGAKKTGKENT
jgi:anti-sigma regulatory factor (Ser/Thr protein kinase)